MAAGDPLFTFESHNNSPPSSSAATPDRRNGHDVLDFDAAADEEAYFGTVIPRHYSGGGITSNVVYMASVGTTGGVVWELSFERHDTGTDLDADSFGTAVSALSTTPGVSGAPDYLQILHSTSQIDSLAVGESFRAKLRRLGASDTTDTTSGDAEFMRLECYEST
jgi:hypothetical protein